MYCKNLKIRSRKGKKYFYCSLLKKEITINFCQTCPSKEYKNYKPLQFRTKKLAKREKKRFSIIYIDLTKCCVCGSKIGIEKNEIYEGAYRQSSINYGMIAPFCKRHHNLFHLDILFNLKYKAIFQEEFIKNHSLEEFIAIFKQDYIYLYNKKTS